MAEDAVTETATAAEEVSKKDDLEALKETAKEKLEAAINGSGGSDNDGDKTEKAGNGATETSADTDRGEVMTPTHRFLEQ